MREDLNWWQRNASIGKNPIRLHKFTAEISSDASLTGWGAHFQDRSTHGFWTKKEKQFSINYLELLAAFFALECFVSELRNCEILLRLDNTTAIAYINKAGGVQLPHLSELARC